jgi:rhamnosyltransferase
MLSSQALFQRAPDSAGTAASRVEPARPRVLVLLATYNGSRWIREQVESILGQQGVNIEIVARDDASTDDTHRELARLAADERVRILTASAPSGSAARNFLTLIRENPASAFDLVAFADQDDLWNPNKLRRACQMLASSGAVGYSSATVATWEDGRQRLLKLSGAPTASDFLFEGAGQGCTFVLSADFYERIRGFLLAHGELTDGIHYHDWLVYALARSWGLPWCFDAWPSMQYRQHARNDTGARGTFQGIARRLARIRDGWYRGQLRVIAEICRTAAPANPVVLTWYRSFAAEDSLRKRLGVARFCLGGGRRRTLDKMVAVMAALRGWI